MPRGFKIAALSKLGETALEATNICHLSDEALDKVLYIVSRIRPDTLLSDVGCCHVTGKVFFRMASLRVFRIASCCPQALCSMVQDRCFDFSLTHAVQDRSAELAPYLTHGM